MPLLKPAKNAVVILLALPFLCLKGGVAISAEKKDAGPSVSSANTLPSQTEIYPTLKRLATFDNQMKKDESQSFYKDAKRGWYYFEGLADEEQPKKEEDPREIIAFDWDAFQKLSSKETNLVMKELQDFAVTHQSKKHSQLYMTAQYIVKEKSKGFMNTWAEVLREHPFLDATVRRPASTYVSNHLAGIESKTQTELIQIMAQDPNVGLILFHSYDCYYCSLQKPLVEDFIKSTGWKTVQFVDITGRTDLVDKFKIETIPEIWLAIKDKEMVRVTAGLRTLDVIQENLVKAYTIVMGPTVHDPYKMTTTIDKIKGK